MKPRTYDVLPALKGRVSLRRTTQQNSIHPRPERRGFLERCYKTQGIVLARKEYSESDRIISIYTKDFGRVTLLAKGVRKPKSRKRGHIEVFSYITFQAARGKGIDIMTEVEVIDNFSKVRRDLKRVALAYYLMEVIGKITSEWEVNQDLFARILDYLNLLKNAAHLKNLRLKFITDILVDLGFWPQGKPLENPDLLLESITEKKINSVRVGRKILA